MKDLDSLLDGHEVRLFSISGIKGDKEAESRATSALLSMVEAVSEFGRLVVKLAGGPSGFIECFTEVEFKKNERDTEVSRPDGIIRVTRGKTTWIALVEVKVGVNGLGQEQFDRYHNLGREQGFDALITISNQPALPNGHPPLKVDQRKAKGTPVVHLSWERLLSEAQLLSWKDGIADEDQEYMLSEWIRYVSEPSAKISVAPSVGSYWNDLKSAAVGDKLATVKSDLEEFVTSWSGFLRVQSFRLRAQLGERKVEVRLKGEEKKKPDLYIKRLTSEAIQSKKLHSSLVIPHTAGDLNVTLDLASRYVFFDVVINAPELSTVRGQIGWIVGQLKKLENVPSGLLLIVDWKKKGLISEVAVDGIAENRDDLMFDNQKQPIPKDAEIRKFVIQWSTKLPNKQSAIFHTIGNNIEAFYQGVVQNLVVYVPPAPKLTKKDKAPSSSSCSSNPQPMSIPSWPS